MSSLYCEKQAQTNTALAEHSRFAQFAGIIKWMFFLLLLLFLCRHILS